MSADGLGNVYISGHTGGSLGGPYAGVHDAFVAKIADAAVPEPSSLLTLRFGSLALLWRRRRLVCASILAAAVGMSLADRAVAVTIDTVPIGNPGNAGELSGAGACAGGYGPDAIVAAVAYNYRIGTTEVTNSQYAEFLNAKAASDPFGLYNTFMSDGLNYGGITQSGPSGSYTYATIAGRGDMPVNWVSWYDSIRFANWLHNGQGSGDTETGAYTLGRLIPTAHPSMATASPATPVRLGSCPARMNGIRRRITRTTVCRATSSTIPPLVTPFPRAKLPPVVATR